MRAQRDGANLRALSGKGYWSVEAKYFSSNNLVEIRQRARAGPARISAAPTGTGGGACRRALGGDREDRKLRSQVLALTAGAGSALASSNQSFEPTFAFLTDVFKNWHQSLPFHPRIYERLEEVLQFPPDTLLSHEVLLLIEIFRASQQLLIGVSLKRGAFSFTPTAFATPTGRLAGVVQSCRDAINGRGESIVEFLRVVALPLAT